MDKNGNGRVGVNDVIHSAQMINANPSKTEVEDMIKRVDTDGKILIAVVRVHIFKLNLGPCLYDG